MIQPICGLLGYTDAIMNGIEGSNPKAALFSLANQRRDVMMTRFLDAWDFDRYSHLCRGLGPQKSGLALQNGDTQPPQVIFWEDVFSMIMML